ncbi:LAETG motif-containing sortase-dependent surface protein [Streptomyces sp. NPDC058287]|uniref:LAETG motif-containing sortase-dependent surface protein n=1 Tax=unclassified Streptomyces TaxID=2593676 RepID=UPI0036E08BFE
MKLRRALAAAAATAAIAPIALLSAPAAFADEPAPPAASETVSSAPEAAPETSTTPAEAPSSNTASPAESASETASTSATPTQSASESATTSPSPSVSASPSDEPGECSSETDSKDVYTELRGLPSKIVAGSGWVDFTYRVTNKSKKDMHSVEAYVYAFSIDGKDFEDTSKHLTLQWQIDGTWQDISLDGDGFFGSTDELAPGEYADAKMRLKVDAKAPAGYGAALTAGVSVDGDGNCAYGDVKEFDFDILAAGSTVPGDVPDSEGKPGKGNNKPGPQGGLDELPVTGSLAETGSSSMVPTIGLIGGVAVVAGAGAVFAVRRRKAGATA